MTQQTSGPPPRRSTLTRAARWWLAVGVFIVGVLVGGVLVGLISEGSPRVSGTLSGEAPGSSAPAPTISTDTNTMETTSPGVTAEATVNEACLRAINAAEDAFGAINDIGEAARNFDALALDGIIRRLQPLQSNLRADLDACRVTTRLPDGATAQTSVPRSSQTTLTARTDTAPTTG